MILNILDGKLFIEKMTEWGVELEEVDSIFSNPKYMSRNRAFARFFLVFSEWS